MQKSEEIVDIQPFFMFKKKNKKLCARVLTKVFFRCIMIAEKRLPVRKKIRTEGVTKKMYKFCIQDTEFNTLPLNMMN